MAEMILINPRKRSRMKKRSRIRRASSRRKSFKPRRRRVVKMRRRTRRNPVAAISSRRRRSRKVSFRRRTRRNPVGFLKGIISTDDIMLGAGAALSSLGTGFVLSKFGNKLPPIGSPAISAAVYGAGIPILLGWGIAKFIPSQRALAKGFVIGGITTGLNVALNKALATVAPTSGAGMFLQGTTPRSLGLNASYPTGMSGLTMLGTNGLNGFQDQAPAFNASF